MLTIIIPSYNHRNYILDCVQAALAVNVPGRKIIVIDDGSTDGTDRLVENFISNAKRLDIVLIRKSNSGLVSSLNLGLRLANTEYFYLVASDDIPKPSGIQSCIEELRSHPDCAFCIGGGEIFYEDRSERKGLYGERQEKFLMLEETRRLKAMFLDYPSPILLQSCIFRLKSLVEVGGWDPEIMLDDYSMFIKLLTRYPKNGIDFIFRPDFHVVGYRQHGHNNFKNITRQFVMVKQVIVSLAPSKLKAKAEGKALAGYLLSSLRAANYDTVKEILKLSSVSAKIFVLPFLIKIIASKIYRRLL
ncbi:glycosyltransferase family 2 protein [Pseudomonas sp. D2-30]|uniref:glycosyltransferase family 2 protein n=1 Tax=unclassified Pseudomonas TaxID=196821 RepID=UPI003DA82F4F